MIGFARFSCKVMHLVVEEKARIASNYSSTTISIDCIGTSYGIPVAVHYRKMGGVDSFLLNSETSIEILGI